MSTILREPGLILRLPPGDAGVGAILPEHDERRGGRALGAAQPPGHAPGAAEVRTSVTPCPVHKQKYAYMRTVPPCHAQHQQTPALADVPPGHAPSHGGTCVSLHRQNYGNKSKHMGVKGAILTQHQNRIREPFLVADVGARRRACVWRRCTRAKRRPTPRSNVCNQERFSDPVLVLGQNCSFDTHML